VAIDQLEAERCICAAIKLPNGDLVKGRRHNNCISLAVELGASRGDIAGAIQGFMTTTGRFVDRKVGMEIQKASGLPSKYSHDGVYRGEILFSEDLY